MKCKRTFLNHIITCAHSYASDYKLCVTFVNCIGIVSNNIRIYNNLLHTNYRIRHCKHLIYIFWMIDLVMFILYIYVCK